MKNYNKILEAVNRGIQLALDDFDDEEQVQNVKSKQVQNRDYTKNYWVKNYDPTKLKHNLKDDGGIKWLNGRIFEGKNGNQIFIPAAGYCGGHNYNDRAYCYLWSSSLHLDFPFQAYDIYIDSSNIRVNSSARHNGYSIRPVINL